MRSAICFTLSTMSVTSSRTPAIEENSCSTPSIWIEVTAAPCSEDKQHAAQRIAERQAEAALQRLGDDGRLPAHFDAGFNPQLLRLDQFLPVLLKHFCLIVSRACRTTSYTFDG